MVQAINEEFDEDQEDVSQALALLREMNTNVQHVAQLVDNMIVKVHKGELSTTQGLSFLEMKYHMLLSYLINVTYAILRKCSGETIEGDPSIDRLVEIRTVLEKIRPIDHRLKYQIDKLVKAAVIGTVEENDPSMLRANPDNLLASIVESSESGEEAEEDDMGTKDKKSTSVYVPPKLVAMHYDGGETITEKNKKLQEYKKKHNLHSSVIEDLREEYLDTPREVSHGNYAQQSFSRYEQEKTEFEENYLTRLPETKTERNRRKQLNSVGNIADEIVYGHSSLGKSSKRKRQSSKTKKKTGGGKKRRFQ